MTTELYHAETVSQRSNRILAAESTTTQDNSGMEDIISTMKVLPMTHGEQVDMAVQMVQDAHDGISKTRAHERVLSNISNMSIFELSDDMF